jgi:predicted TPR repeat methyltransferase
MLVSFRVRDTLATTDTSAAAGAATDLRAAAMAAHQAGRFDEAEALYRQRLHDQPADADAWHLQGVLLAQRRRHAEAQASIEMALALQPGEAIFHNNLGNVCIERGDADGAERHYRQALALDGTRLDAANNLGVLLSRRGSEEAEALLRAVVQAAPDFHDAHQNLANHYLRHRRLADAVQQCFDGLVVAPRSGSLRRLLGMAYVTTGHHDKAAEVYRAWLDVEPDNPLARHHLQALTGEGVDDRASDAYVARVFDSFANSFDAKLAELSYRAPEQVTEVLGQLVGAPARSLDVLDAGCGTGLCAPLLSAYARRLDGVDLSSGMVQRARARGGYDTLEVGELVAHLQARPAAYDAVVAADTLCYFGALEGWATGAAGALRPGGVVVFTVEAHDDTDDAPDHRLHPHGRYSHRRRYVERALRAAGLEVAAMQAAVLRHEAKEPVHGWVAGARKPAGV